MLHLLDESILAHILSFSDSGPTVAGNLAQCNRHFAELIEQADNTIWRSICTYMYKYHDKSNNSYKRNVHDLVKLLRSDVTVSKAAATFRDISSIWNRLANWYAAHAPEIAETLMPPLSLDQSREPGFEERWYSVPLPLRCLYLNCQGQVSQRRSNTGTGAFGGIECYDFIVDFALIDYEQALLLQEQYNMKGRGVIPFSVSQTRYKAMIMVAGDDSICRLRRPGYARTHDNLSEFLEDLADNLYTGQMTYTRNAGISRYLNRDPMGSITVTRGVKITCSPLFVPEMSSTGQYCYAYRITIECVSPDTPKCQLTERHWEIVDYSSGERDVVHGPGVIGMFPTVFYGCPKFEYCSRTVYSTADGGEMSGYFTFRVLDGSPENSSETFNAMISPFKMGWEYSAA